MRYILLICAGLLLLALTDLPIGYYTFLRIVVTISAIVVLVQEHKNRISFWIISFGIIVILFNPIIPIYLNNKSIWLSIDILVAIIFIVKSLITNKKDE
jgi:hypothetical protein